MDVGVDVGDWTKGVGYDTPLPCHLCARYMTGPGHRHGCHQSRRRRQHPSKPHLPPQKCEVPEPRAAPASPWPLPPHSGYMVSECAVLPARVVKEM